MPTRILALAAVALALSACAGPIVWHKSGASTQDFNRDKYACLRDAKALGGAVYVGYGRTVRTTDWVLYGDCMIARGWTATREGR